MKKLIFAILITSTFAHSMKKSQTSYNLTDQQTTSIQPTKNPSEGLIKRITKGNTVSYEAQLNTINNCTYVLTRCNNLYTAYIKITLHGALDAPNLIVREEITNEEAEARFKNAESKYLEAHKSQIGSL